VIRWDNVPAILAKLRAAGAKRAYLDYLGPSSLAETSRSSSQQLDGVLERLCALFSSNVAFASLSDSTGNELLQEECTCTAIAGCTIEQLAWWNVRGMTHWLQQWCIRTDKHSCTQVESVTVSDSRSDGGQPTGPLSVHACSIPALIPL